MVTGSRQDVHLLARECARMADAVDQRSANLGCTPWKTRELQRDGSRSVLAIQLDPTAAVVLAGVGTDLERPVGTSGGTWTRTIRLVGANDCNGDTAIVSR